MKAFMDKDFLLSSETAKRLYHEYAADQPIIDYHCHVSPREIYEDKCFENIAELWLGGDHYKWRVMRSCGVDEYYITGDAPAKEKFLKFAACLPRAIGNPMYHWCHLELKKYFSYEGILSPDTAEEVWDLTKRKLAEGGLSVRQIIKASGVYFIGTTDDPVDSLEWHKNIAEDDTFDIIVAPSYRPDKAVNIDKAGWREYIDTLSGVCGFDIKTFADIERALEMRLDHFVSHGCKASDHALDRPLCTLLSREELEDVTARALNGEAITEREAEGFKTALYIHCGRMYHDRGMAMQIHYNCLRNPNSVMFKKLGPDTGFDCMGPDKGGVHLAELLDCLNREGALPKTIIYSLDPTDNEFIGTLLGSFQGTEVPGKIQHGSAWWFNDHKVGMTDQLTSLGNLGVLGNFVGMLTDSRSFLSYTRHEYFRRIMCDLFGKWVENGEYPDTPFLAQMVQDICFNNAKRYFDI